MKNSTLNIFTSIILILATSCGKEEFSPNQKFDRNSPHNINAKSIARLQQSSGDDTIRFVLAGDSQRAYDDLVPFVKTVNEMQNVDFVVIDGDISDFGLLQEMEWVHKTLSGLKMPYIGVIGNHDHEANGTEVFKNMFGELDYSFVYRNTKFICHNTNSREYNFNGTVPDLPWLDRQLASETSVDGYVAISHVPANSFDFDPKLKDGYGELVTRNQNIYAVLNAHVDKAETSYPYEGGPPFIATNSLYNRQFIIIEIYGKKLTSRTVHY